MLFQKLFIKVSCLWKYQQFGNNQYIIVVLNPFLLSTYLMSGTMKAFCVHYLI